MKDMGEADAILGIKIKRKNKRIVITQSHYIEKIIKKFNREDCSPVSTLMNLIEKLKPNTGKLVDQLEYSRAIGYLMYVMRSTRSDIAYVVGRVSRFTSNPSRHYWKAIKRVFKYLRGTKDYGLSYVGYPSMLECYSDVSWINHVEDSSFTSGWVFLLGEVPFHRLPKSKHASLAYSQVYNGKSRHLGIRHSVIRTLIMKSKSKITLKWEGGFVGDFSVINDYLVIVVSLSKDVWLWVRVVGSGRGDVVLVSWFKGGFKLENLYGGHCLRSWLQVNLCCQVWSTHLFQATKNKGSGQVVNMVGYGSLVFWANRDWQTKPPFGVP
nr:zinc finger, CCHC-type [Tanacetum cinerariifolium]GEW44197.1 zinc finger, CCHC-type [Tanacetum cinerariifolium]